MSSSSAETSQQMPDPTLLDDLEQDLGTQIEILSDEVPLMRPNGGRHVEPNIFQAVDASPRGAMRVSGADHVFEATPQVCATGSSPSAERLRRPIRPVRQGTDLLCTQWDCDPLDSFFAGWEADEDEGSLRSNWFAALAEAGL